MIKTEWVPASTCNAGHWETHDEPTGQLKQGLFGVKEVKAPKQRWVETDKPTPNIVDGKKLAQDIETAANKLLADGFSIMQITPITSGRFDHQTFDRHPDSAATCASWGYGITEGVIIVAAKN
jgi:hypothetical protein